MDVDVYHVGENKAIEACENSECDDWVQRERYLGRNMYELIETG